MPSPTNRERELIDLCIQRLEDMGFSCQLTPTTRRRNQQTLFECEEDYELLVEGPKGSQRFILEIKSRAPNPQTSSIARHLSYIGQREGFPVMLFTEYISPRLAEGFRAEKINFVDTSGNILIDGERTLIYISGKPMKRSPVRTPRLDTGSYYNLLGCLLTLPANEEPTYRELANLTNLSLGTIHNTLGKFHHSGVLKAGSQTQIDSRKAKGILRRWVQGYSEKLRPDIFIRHFRLRERDSFESFVKRIEAAGLKKELLVSGEFAAEILDRYVHATKMSLFGSIEGTRMPKKLGLFPTKDGSIAYLRLPGKWACWTNSTNQEMAFTHPLLIYGELFQGDVDSRIQEAAELLEKRILQSEDHE